MNIRYSLRIGALQRKYPSAERELGGQYVFPATRLWRDPELRKLG